MPRPGAPAAGVIRLERVRLADSPGSNRVPMRLETAMYLGERTELALRRGGWAARCFAGEVPAAAELLVELPPEALWIYPG